MTKRIPIKAAKEISKAYDFPEVVIFGYDPRTGPQTVTTYGRSLDQCADAAKAGNFLKRALQWPKADCQAIPTRMKKATKK
jgi:hypothetical protein